MFDIKTYVQNLRATKPPYECPIKACGKVYKSYSGIQFHLLNFDHDCPENNQGKKPGSARKARQRWQQQKTNRGRTPSPPEFFKPPSQRDPLSYAEAQRLVEVDLDGNVHRINIFESLDVITQDEYENYDNLEKEERPEKNIKVEKKEPAPEPKPMLKLPEASFKVLDDFVKPPQCPTRPNSYYRFIEKTTEELDEEVEYDMDEEVSLLFNLLCTFPNI